MARSGVAAVAAVASSGAAVLAVCADALRRRDLVERAAAPIRFGGGEVAIASGRLADGANRDALASVADAGSGVVLADWAALAREPSSAGRFEHLVVIDPAPFAHLERMALAGPGFAHLAWGDAELELALRVHDEEWPRRPALVALFRALRGAAGARETNRLLDRDALRATLHGPGTNPRSPEVDARRLRVLEELGALRWEGSGTTGGLRVVSSKGDLERLESFAAYRQRYEEGRTFLSDRRQPS